MRPFGLHVCEIKVSYGGLQPLWQNVDDFLLLCAVPVKLSVLQCKAFNLPTSSLFTPSALLLPPLYLPPPYLTYTICPHTVPFFLLSVFASFHTFSRSSLSFLPLFLPSFLSSLHLSCPSLPLSLSLFQRNVFACSSCYVHAPCVSVCVCVHWNMISWLWETVLKVSRVSVQCVTGSTK